MAKTTKTSPKKPIRSKTTKSPKKSVSTTKATVRAKKPAAKKAATASRKVDYYPNRMTLAVSVLAGTMLVLITLIAVLGIQ